jgi:hypothetical protein
MLLCGAEGPSSVRAPSTIRGGTTTSLTTAAAHLVKDTKEEKERERLKQGEPKIRNLG